MHVYVFGSSLGLGLIEVGHETLKEGCWKKTTQYELLTALLFHQGHQEQGSTKDRQRRQESTLKAIIHLDSLLQFPKGLLHKLYHESLVGAL